VYIKWNRAGRKQTTASFPLQKTVEKTQHATNSTSIPSLLLGNWQEQLEFWGQFLLGVQAVGEVQSTNSAICVQRHSERLDVVRAVCTSREVREVELNLIPALIQSHRHRADEWLYARCRLVVGSTEASANALVVKYLHLEREVLFEILDDHHKEGELNSESLVCIRRACDKARVDVATDKLENGALDVLICEPLDVSVTHLLVPNL